ncbi:MAG: HAD family hydrolase [Bacteroidota bacterium]|nr:HAD family hydrolase [Bacteroidota bacterium]MDP4275667.1 HAD family hydrolase [Bacteroidota bacterium]
MKKSLTAAIIYDFDGTLSPGNMQEYDFIPHLGKKPSEFWDEAKRLTVEQQGDRILAYMELMLKEANYKGVEVKKESFQEFGKNVELFAGAQDWFDRINAFGNALDIKVEHYIVSSGLREMIEGTLIAGKFKKIYASGYMYNSNGVAYWPALAVNYTTKTQFLFRINKGVLDEWDDSRINEFVAEEDRPVPFHNMIYLGDGTTDVPCMKLVKEQGGHSIAVYKSKTKGAKTDAEKLIEQQRVNFIAPADYSENNKIDKLVKAILTKISSDNLLKNLG